MSLSAVNKRVAALEAEMAAAVEREHYEAAARLRDEIAALKGQSGDAAPAVRKPPPGEMGLGTHIPLAAPPEGWTRPKKPDPMTSRVKGRRR
jgi:hypothetical protein